MAGAKAMRTWLKENDAARYSFNAFWRRQLPANEGGAS
jgi:hypothetical protein